MRRRGAVPREVRETVKLLGHVASAATALAGVIEDLHVLAYDRASSGAEDAGRISRGGATWYLDEVGQAEAKVALRALTGARSRHGAVELERAMRVHYERVFALFSGPGADESLRGTILGDDCGAGAQAELTQALKARQRRRERGEYSPTENDELQRRRVGR